MFCFDGVVADGLHLLILIDESHISSSAARLRFTKVFAIIFRKCRQLHLYSIGVMWCLSSFLNCDPRSDSLMRPKAHVQSVQVESKMDAHFEHSNALMIEFNLEKILNYIC